MTTTTKGERRGKSRKRPVSLVYVELAGGNGGMMKDLSPEGFSIRAMMPLRLGEKNPFTFSLSETVRIEGEGQVVWVEENGRVAGIQFARIPASAHEQIESWLIRPESPPKREHAGGTAKTIRDTTIEQLREELHTTPPRNEGTAAVERPAPQVVERTAPPVVERTAPAVTEAPLARMVVQHAPPVIGEPAPVGNKPQEPPAPVEAAPPTAPPSVEAPVPQPTEPPAAPPGEAAAPVPPVVPAPTPASEPVFAEAPPTLVQAPPAKTAAEVPAAQTTATVAGTPVEETTGPALPPLRLDPPATEPQAKPTEFVQPSFPFPPAATSKREKWPLHIDTEPHPESQSPEATHALPDISSVLMQPSTSSSHAVHAASFDAISSWDGETTARESRGMSVSTVIATMTVLALLAGLYVFHQEVGQSLIWLGQTVSGSFQTDGQKPATTDSSGDSAGNSPASQNASATPRDSGQDSSSAQAEGGSNKAGAGTEKAADATSPAANPAAVNPPAPSPVTNANSAPPVSPLAAGVPPSSSASAPGPEPGQMEYSEAMQILRGKYANSAQLTEVSRLLWVSVEKGNPSAELALAEMYWEGRGVARNCDQTLILLTAAARKGSVEAQKRLQEFERQGCE